MCCVASVISTASPSPPPTWREVLTRPEARPAWPCLAPCVAAIVEGTIDIAIPAAVSMPGDHTYTIGAAARADPREAAAARRSSSSARCRAPARTPKRLTSLPGARGDEHDRQRHRQEDQAGVQRREAEHLLQVERADEPHREQRGAEQQDDRCWRRCSGLVSSLNGISGADAKRASITPNSAEQRERRRRSARARRPCPSPAGRLRRRRRRAPSGRSSASARRRGRSSSPSRSRRRSRHDRVGDERGGDRDRRVDQQHPAPAELLGDDPAEQHAGGAAEAVHRRPGADRAVQLRARARRRR